MHNRRFALLLIGAASLYGALSIVATVAGAGFARHHPGILTWFSFRDGPFSWSYNFSDGGIGPFVIGEDRKEVWKTVRQSNFTVYSRSSDAPSVNAITVPQADEISYDRDDILMLTEKSDSSEVLYILHFNGSKLKLVHIHSSLFSGL